MRASASAGARAARRGGAAAWGARGGRAVLRSQRRPRRPGARGRPRARLLERLLERSAQLGERAAVPRRGRQRRVERARERARQVPAPAPRAAASGAPDAPRGRGRCRAAHRVDAAKRLVEHERERVEVGLLADLAALALLGSHVGERAEHVAGARQGVLAGEARAAEVGQLCRRALAPAPRSWRSGTSTFWGLTSRWMTPRSWACSSAHRRARRRSRAALVVERPPSAISSRERAPSTSSEIR